MWPKSHHIWSLFIKTFFDQTQGYLPQWEWILAPFFDARERPSEGVLVKWKTFDVWLSLWYIKTSSDFCWWRYVLCRFFLVSISNLNYFAKAYLPSSWFNCYLITKLILIDLLCKMISISVFNTLTSISLFFSPVSFHQLQGSTKSSC